MLQLGASIGLAVTLVCCVPCSSLVWCLILNLLTRSSNIHQAWSHLNHKYINGCSGHDHIWS